MLRLATVFSGIGAIEHALDRMQIEHKIVFACDNGDVELDLPKVNADIDEIKNELINLKETIKNITTNVKDEDSVDYASQLEFMLNGADNELKKLLENLQLNEEVELLDVALSDIQTIIQEIIDHASTSKRNKYKKLTLLKNNNASNEAKLFFILHIGLTLNEDEIQFQSDAISSLLKKYENELKRLIKSGKDIAERLTMIHEKLFYLEKNNELNQMKSYEDRKQYVDKMYAGKESQNKVRKSYMSNYDIAENDFHWNVAFLDGKQYENQVDLFVGGSPCQSFSLVGKQRGLEDTRGTLFYEYARLIKEINPKVFIYENVKAILNNDNGKTWEKMKEVFENLGYKVFYTFNGKPSVLNAKDYGIPQNRERVFVVGFRSDLKFVEEFTFPSPIPLEKKMQDFLLDHTPEMYYLPKNKKTPSTNQKEIMVDLEKYFLSEKTEKYVMATGTKNFYSKPKTDLEVARPLLTTMHKMHRAGVDNYVHTNGRLRKLTPRECLRLMGFCDSFKIVVSDTAMYQQAGNSIVVDVLIAIMNQIIQAVGVDQLNNNT